jgi:hypothetical protein
VITPESPLGRALAGAHPGSTIFYTAGANRSLRATVVSVEYSVWALAACGPLYQHWNVATDGSADEPVVSGVNGAVDSLAGHARKLL